MIKPIRRKPTTVVTTIRIPALHLAALRKLKEVTGLSMQDLIRRAIEGYVKGTPPK